MSWFDAVSRLISPSRAVASDSNASGPPAIRVSQDSFPDIPCEVIATPIPVPQLPRLSIEPQPVMRDSVAGFYWRTYANGALVLFNEERLAPIESEAVTLFFNDLDANYRLTKDEPRMHVHLHVDARLALRLWERQLITVVQLLQATEAEDRIDVPGFFVQCPGGVPVEFPLRIVRSFSRDQPFEMTFERQT